MLVIGPNKLLYVRSTCFIPFFHFHCAFVLSIYKMYDITTGLLIIPDTL